MHNIRYDILLCTHSTTLCVTILSYATTTLYYTTLRSATLPCSALNCTALHCIALHCTALHCTALHCTALHCTALRCTALYDTVHIRLRTRMIRLTRLTLTRARMLIRRRARTLIPTTILAQYYNTINEAILYGDGMYYNIRYYTMLHTTLHCTIL